MDILEVKNLEKHFRGLAAISSVSFSIKEGEILGLIGPNGAGKTTMFNLITGMIGSDGGKIVFRGKDITKLREFEISRKGIARTFQGGRYFRNESVFNNLLFSRHSRTKSGVWGCIVNSRLNRKEEEENRAEIANLTEFLGIESFRDYLVSDVPNAVQTRVGIGIGLITKPSLLLLDEPVAGLNPSETNEMMGLIRKIMATGITILLVEHNMKAIMGICERIVVIDSGVKIAEGSPEEVSKNTRVVEAYLGKGGIVVA
jgi:branched-chain amino acid transport system ATP-binding protein